MLHVLLYQPEIAPNTGNIIRLCANTGASLHLIQPLGFELDDARLRRAGLDYHEYAHVLVDPDLDACRSGLPTGTRVWAITTHGRRRPDQAVFRAGDALLFGPESRGLPAALLERFPSSDLLRIPMLPTSRSLNLSNAVAVTVYEAWRQLNFDGARSVAWLPDDTGTMGA